MYESELCKKKVRAAALLGFAYVDFDLHSNGSSSTSNDVDDSHGKVFDNL